MENTPHTTFEELSKQKRSADTSVVCAGCSKRTEDWALRRVSFVRQVKDGDRWKQTTRLAFSTGRYCADCAAKEKAEHEG